MASLTIQEPSKKKMKVETLHESQFSSVYGASTATPTTVKQQPPTSDDENDANESPMSIIAQFQSDEGSSVGPRLDLPLNSNVNQMEELVNQLLEQTGKSRVPYSFYVGDTEVTKSLQETVEELKLSTETALTITFQPLAAFRVRPVTRCSDTLQGHSEAILHVSFSPDGKRLASGGGDATVRFWDTNTCMPKHTGRGHKHHVLCTAWSPDGERFASADRNGEIRLWDPSTGKQLGQPLTGHKQWVNSLSWEPMHRDMTCERFASGSKDGTIKIWNARTGRQLISLSGHTDSVECIKWGGEGLLYSASRDRTIKVWAVEGENLGKLVRTLIGHGHRINTLALNVDYVCRSGPFDHTNRRFASRDEMQVAALERYNAVRKSQPERLVSGSDDFTLFFWEPAENKKPIERLVGHQQPVNHLSFSPDGRYFASASFDKKVKIWNGQTGKFVATLNGHVGAVYQVCWSADSRLIVSASKDSTVKVWELADLKNAKVTLSGHEDEVYALDWSPNGDKVASGSKDRKIKVVFVSEKHCDPLTVFQTIPAFQRSSWCLDGGTKVPQIPSRTSNNMKRQREEEVVVAPGATGGIDHVSYQSPLRLGPQRAAWALTAAGGPAAVDITPPKRQRDRSVPLDAMSRLMTAATSAARMKKRAQMTLTSLIGGAKPSATATAASLSCCSICVVTQQTKTISVAEMYRCAHCERAMGACCSRECDGCASVFCSNCSTINCDEQYDRVFCLTCNYDQSR